MTEIPKRLLNGRNRIAKRGGIVLVHYGPEVGEVQYQLLDGGGVSKSMLDKLIEAGFLKAQTDGLFDGHPQTYKIV